MKGPVPTKGPVPMKGPVPTKGPAVAVIGAGAIGLAAAAALDAAGRRVLLCLRRVPDVLGWTVDGPEHPITADLLLPDQKPAAPVAVAMVATRAVDDAGTIRRLREVAAPDALVVILRNGLDHVPALQAAGLPPAMRVLPAVLLLAARRVAAGRVVIEGRHPEILLPEGPDGRKVAELFTGGPIHVTTSRDWITIAWEKLLVNAAVGGVATLTGLSYAGCGGPEARQACIALIDEAAAVARAEGAAIEPAPGNRLMAQALSRAGDHLPSIARDRQAGRPTEWATRNGVIARLATRHDIAVPLNALLVRLLRCGEPS